MKLIIIMIFTSMIFSETYKEPNFTLLKKDGSIEIRQYEKYVIAKTSIPLDGKDDNNMFRTLASYIFGGNENNESIPMTAPVTTYQDNDKYNMVFYMLDADSVTDMPATNNQDIVFEEFEMGKCAVISFSWFTTDTRINHYKDKLSAYLNDNKITPKSTYMVNRYDPPWRMPFMRRNEILVKIN